MKSSSLTKTIWVFCRAWKVKPDYIPEGAKTVIELGKAKDAIAPTVVVDDVPIVLEAPQLVPVPLNGDSTV